MTAIIVMGVSGSGKTTVAARLASEFGARFIEGDDLHPARNKEKMRDGLPLDDVDRMPWLEAIGTALGDTPADGTVVVACSALKRSYRDLLRRHDADALFVCLGADVATIRERLAERSHEFMNPALLSSQLAAFEPLGSDERGVEIDSSARPAETVASVLREISQVRALPAESMM